jgi:hypothetical protein
LPQHSVLLREGKVQHFRKINEKKTRPDILYLMNKIQEIKTRISLMKRHIDEILELFEITDRVPHSYYKAIRIERAIEEFAAEDLESFFPK